VPTLVTPTNARKALVPLGVVDRTRAEAKPFTTRPANRQRDSSPDFGAARAAEQEALSGHHGAARGRSLSAVK
jgi:hypothetical protein